MYVTTSWDDGHPLDLRVAELLAKYGVEGTFYVPGRNSEGRPVLSGTELRTLGERFEIGGHTLDHVRLVGPSAKRQIVEGKERIEQELGRAIDGFCYPGGVHAPDVRELVRDAGFRYARTIDNFHAQRGGDPYRVPTTLQLYPHRRRVYVRNFVRRGAWAPRSKLFARAMMERSFDALLATLLDEVERQDGVFHLWGHSWEIEENGLWPVLERFLALVEKRVPRERRQTNGSLFANA